MDQKVEKQLQLIDQKLSHLFVDLQQYSLEKLKNKPTPESWSVLDVLQHLILVENASVKYVQKKLSFNPKLSNVNVGTVWRMFILKSYNWLPFKLKAPSYVNEQNFSKTAELNELIAKWQAQRHQLRDYLQTLPADVYNKEIYKHPIAGRLSLNGMLQFFDGHFDRHYKQIQKLLKG